MSSQYYKATAYVGTGTHHDVEVTIPLVGPQGPAGEAGGGAVESVNGQTGVVVLAAVNVGAAATSHTHGNLTNAGAIGTTSGLPVKTGTSGVIEAGAFGTSAGQFAEGNHTHTPASLGAAQAVTDIELTPNGTTTITTAQLPARGIAYTDGAMNFTVNLPTPNIRQSGLTFSIKRELEGEGGEVFITVVHNAATLVIIELEEAEGSWDFFWDGYEWTWNNTYFLRSTPSRTLLLPQSSGTLALTQQSDDSFRILGSVDQTKRVAFEVDGLSSGTTRTLTVPNASGTLALTQQSSDMEITDSTKGIILKSANNTRWRITINNDGTLSRAALALMTLLAFATSGMAQVRDMVTDTNGNIVTGRTNELTLTNNLRFGTLTNANAQTAIIGTNGALSAGSVPSGAAANGALLTADGAGSSSFVASKTTVLVTTNDSNRTNTSSATDTNNNESALSTITLDANSIYNISYSVLVTSAGTNGWAGWLDITTNALIGAPLGRGGRANFTFTDITITAAGGRGLATLPAQGSAFTNGVFAGSVLLRIGNTNSALTFRWAQNTSGSNVTTMLSNSVLIIEKIWP
jgi:hypothetical protein